MRRAWAWCGLTGALAVGGCGDGSETGSGGSGASGTVTSGDAQATSGSGSSGATSSSTAATSGSGGSAPNLEPVFVAIGAGAWSATSCDRGQTWTVAEFSADRDDHSEWSAFGGLAFGHDAFVMATGWGYPGHVLRSADGVAWEDLDDAAFRDGFESSVGGVAFDGQSFLLFGEEVWSSADGSTWTITDRSLPQGAHQLRQLRAFSTGLIVASVETQYGSDHPLGHWIVTSTDGGATWTEGSGNDQDCSNPIQHWGDIELKDGVLLVGANALCRSTDQGQTWSGVAFPGDGSIRDLFADDAWFYAASGSRIYRSADGTAWEETADLGTAIAKGVWGDGTYVAMNGDGTRVFSSSNGADWSEGTIPTDLTPAVVRDLGVGYLADAVCP